MVKDFEITIKVKNARLLNKIKERGFKSIRDFAIKTGLSEQGVYRCLSLLQPVYNRNFKLKRLPEKLGEFFNCEPTELFPESVWYEAMELTTASVQMDEEEIRQAMPYLARGEIPALENHIFAEQIDKIKSQLITDRENIVINMKNNGETYDDIGNVIGVTRERVRQIEAKAYRKIRKHVTDKNGDVKMVI